MSNSDKSLLSSVDSSSDNQNANQKYESKSKPSSVEYERYEPKVPSGKGDYSSLEARRKSRRSRDRDDRRHHSPSRGRDRSLNRDRSRSRSHGRRRSPSKESHRGHDRRSSPSRDRYRSRSRERRHSPRRRYRSRSRDRDLYYSRSRYSDRRGRSRDRSRDRHYSRDGDHDYYRDRRYRDRGYNRSRDYDRSRRSRSRSYDRRSPRKSSPKRAPDITDMMNSLIQNMSQKPADANSLLSASSAVSQAMTSLTNTGFLETVPSSLVGSVLLSNPTLSGLGVPKTIDKIVRELYVGNIPVGLGITPVHLREFFDLLMTKTGLTRGSGSSVLSARLSDNSTFGFIELRSPEEADLAMTLNGVPFHGANLRVSRPKGYAQRFGDASSVQAAKMLASSYAGGPAAIELGGAEGEANLTNKPNDDAYVSDSGSTKSNKDATPVDVLRDKLAFVSNLSKQVTSEQLQQMFGHIGTVENVLTVPLDNDDMEAYIEYKESLSVSKAINALNGLPIASRFIKIELANDSQIEDYMKRASAEASQVPESSLDDSAHKVVNDEANTPQSATCYLELLNIVTNEELKSASEEILKEIVDDVTEECSRYGKVVKTVVPPFSQEMDKPPVYVVFELPENAETCANAIRGRLFDNRPVITRFLSTEEAELKHLITTQQPKPDVPIIPAALLSADLD